MEIKPINKLFEEKDLNKDSYKSRTKELQAKDYELWSLYSNTHQLKGTTSIKRRCWEYSTLLESTNPVSGDKVLVLEGFRNPRSILPFYLKDLGCEVYIAYKYHAGAIKNGQYQYGTFVLSQSEPKSVIYDNAGINLIERADWMNVSDFGIEFDIIYVTDHNLEHANKDGVNIGKASNLSTVSYDDVMSVSNRIIDSWLSVSKCVVGATNVFGSNCDFSLLAEENGWEGYGEDYYHPFTSTRLSELISLYQENYTDEMDIGAYYETDWVDYYATNFPLVSMSQQSDLPLDVLYTVGTYVIPKAG